MIDKFLEVGSTFDWITPLWAFVQDFRHGPSAQINVPYGKWSGSQIQSMLKNSGVKSWGLMVVGDTITFTVSKRQERYTRYLIGKWGIA